MSTPSPAPHWPPATSSTTPTVGIYSPSGSVAGEPAEKRELFERGRERLHDLGFATKVAPHTEDKWFHMSASAEDRAADLRHLLDDDEIEVIIPTIGGHVAAQLLPLIDANRIASSGKAFFGFSDNSILPLITSATTGAVTYHTLCDLTFGFGRFADGYPVTEKSFLAAVRDRSFDLQGTGQWRTVTPGRADGILLGGNLKGICSLLGTPWAPDWSDRIMFWESTDPQHAVIQQLQHLHNAGVLDRLGGMIVGRVSTLKETFYGINEVIPVAEFLVDVLGFAGPLVVEADIGHDVENVTLPNGAEVSLVADDQVACAVTVND